MSEKITGYTLLAIGILIIALSLFGVYSVFRGNTEPFLLINSDGISLDMSQFAGAELSPEERRAMSNEDSLRATIIEPELVNKPLNLFLHVLFMGFVSSIGYKIASLGTMLARPIKVKLREEKEGVKASG